MGISYTNGVSVLELVVYFPSLFAATYLVWRHGLRTSAGFIYLILFILLRITGACCNLKSISNPSPALSIAQGICSSIGLSPLILACSGLLSRANHSTHQNPNTVIKRRFFHLLHLTTLVALILSVVGFTSDMSPRALIHPNDKIKAAMILFVVSWFGLCLLLGVLVSRRAEIETGERRLLIAVGVSVVFILVRLIYAMLVFFLADETFNFLDGSATALLVMSVLEEFGVVTVCLGVGMTLPTVKYSGVPLQSTEYGMGKGRGQHMMVPEESN